MLLFNALGGVCFRTAKVYNDAKILNSFDCGGIFLFFLYKSGGALLENLTLDHSCLGAGCAVRRYFDVSSTVVLRSKSGEIVSIECESTVGVARAKRGSVDGYSEGMEVGNGENQTAPVVTAGAVYHLRFLYQFK